MQPLNFAQTDGACSKRIPQSSSRLLGAGPLVALVALPAIRPRIYKPPEARNYPSSPSHPPS